MFGKIDHLTGAIKIRIIRFILQTIGRPDLSHIDHRLSIGGHCDIHTLWKDNVKAIVDLRMEARDDEKDLKKYKIDYLHISIPDRNTPNTADIHQTTDWIQSKINKDLKVFIHCNLGRGRAPLIACAYLIFNGMTKEEAIKIVKRKRTVTYFNQKQLSWLDELKKNQNHKSS